MGRPGKRCCAARSSPRPRAIADYDEPIQLKLKGATVRKVRFENIVPWNDKGKVGLSKVVFHQAIGAAGRTAPYPKTGATSIGIGKLSLDWVAGQGATEHRVFLGTAADNLRWWARPNRRAWTRRS